MFLSFSSFFLLVALFLGASNSLLPPRLRPVRLAQAASAIG
jgi:hypothetical protein